jgi:acid phosphatase type 7
MVGPDKMRVSWITDDDAPAIVEYGTTSGKYTSSATGNTTTYSYVLYNSGSIHDAVIGPLKPNTTYYYRCSSSPAREFSFRTPPAALPFKFVITGKNALYLAAIVVPSKMFRVRLRWHYVLLKP